MERLILVVDDKENRRQTIGDFLKTKGFAVITAADGNEALSLLESDEPDLILTDTKMPNLSGPELVAILQERYWAIPVIGMSNREESRPFYQTFWNKNSPLGELLALILIKFLK